MRSNLSSAGFPVNRIIAKTQRVDQKVTIAGQVFPFMPGRTIPPEAVEHLRDTIRTHIVPALGMVKGRIIESLSRLIPYLGRMQRRITHKMLLEGYYSNKHLAWIVHPVQVSERTLRRHLNELEDMGLIGRTRSGNGQAFTYNFNYALLISRRSVAAIYSTISRLAKHFGSAISTARARIIAENLVKSDDTPEEIESSICKLFEPQTPAILSPHKVPLLSSFGKPTEEGSGGKSEEESSMLKQRRSQRAQPAPTQNDSADICSDTTPDTGSSWQDRLKRRRAVVEDDEENRQVIATGREIADERAAQGGLPIATPEPTQGLRAFVRESLANDLPERAKGRQRSAKATPEHLERVWSESVATATGTPAVGWTTKERSQIRHIVKRVPLTEPTATWASVLSWIAIRWGEANALARPAAFRHEDNVDRIIAAQPRIYHFLKFAEEYAVAYINLFHGEGIEIGQERFAEKLQGVYEKSTVRARLMHKVGSDALPSAVMSNAELTAVVQQAAVSESDARALAALKRKEGYRIAREEYYAGRQVTASRRKEFDKAVQVHRVREGRKEIEADTETLAQFPTVDRSDLYEE